MKYNEIDNIWAERAQSLEQLFSVVKWLLVSEKKRSQKIAIWQEKFNTFSFDLYDQDIELLRTVQE